MPRLTVAIPLFQAAPWHDTVVQNIWHISGDALIVLSDETSSDDTALRVAERFKDDPRIRLRLRNGEPGWREHCNALISECETEFFTLLPQDDLISPAYYEKHIAALDRNPGAGIAFGTMICEGDRYPQPVQLTSPPFRLGLHEPWLEAIELEIQWNLGIPFRGVIRRTALRPIPPTPGDEFADKNWVFGMALTAHVLEVPDALYFKRYHTENTHTRWQEPLLTDRVSQLTGEIRAVLGNSTQAGRAIDYLTARYTDTLRRQWQTLGIC